MNNQILEQQINTVAKGVDELQVQTEDVSEPGPCTFSMLPVELQSRIFVEFMLLVNSSESKLVVLTSISRLWRTTILNTQTLWRRLVISDKTTREKVDMWLQRAGGTFSSLLFVEGFDFDTLFELFGAGRTFPRVLFDFDEPLELFGDIPANIWSSLEHLEIRSNMPHPTLLPPSAYKELRLRSLMLNIVIDIPSEEFWNLLWSIDGSRMRDFQIETDSDHYLIPMSDSRFTDLVTLRLRSCRIEEHHLLDVLERNPMLEILALSDVMLAGRRRPGSSRHVELVNLTSLELWGSGRECVELILQCLMFPNLRVLHLIRCNLLSPGANLDNASVALVEIFLLSSIIPWLDLVKLLRNSCALREVTFVNPNPLGRDAMDLVLEALASPIPSELEGTPLTLCCPLLQHVDFVGVPEMTTESVMKVVKARLPSIGSATTSENSAVKPLPIVHLMFDKCPTVDRESLPWFEANVPEFIYR